MSALTRHASGMGTENEYRKCMIMFSTGLLSRMTSMIYFYTNCPDIRK